MRTRLFRPSKKQKQLWLESVLQLQKYLWPMQKVKHLRPNSPSVLNSSQLVDHPNATKGAKKTATRCKCRTIFSLQSCELSYKLKLICHFSLVRCLRIIHVSVSISLCICVSISLRPSVAMPVYLLSWLAG